MNSLKTKAIRGVVCSLILGIAPPASAGLIETKLTASDAVEGHTFGWSVGISGNTAIIGARGDRHAGGSSGSAYLFDVTTGDELFKLTASDAALGDFFGASVGISGGTAIVGASFNDDSGSRSGSAYLFDADRLSSTFGDEIVKLTASDAAAVDEFGQSVAISGGRAIVGAFLDDDSGSDSGSAYLFDIATGNELFKLTASDAAAGDWFGFSVAISGDIAIVGARADDDAGPGSASGSAYLFDVTTGSQLFKLTASDAAAGDQFGTSVAISGSVAIVGAYLDDDGGSASGAAYLFDVTTGNELFKLTASDAVADDLFGDSVAISGGTAIVGAIADDALTGSAYLFDVMTGNQLLKLTASDAKADDQFGNAVGISGGTAIVGARLDDQAGNFSGSTYLFTPEPSSFLLAALALIGLIAYGCRRCRA